MVSTEMNQLNFDSTSNIQSNIAGFSVSDNYVRSGSVNIDNPFKIGEELLSHSHFTTQNRFGNFDTSGSVFGSYYGNHDKFGYRNQADENMLAVYAMVTKNNKKSDNSIFKIFNFGRNNKTENLSEKNDSPQAKQNIFANAINNDFNAENMT